MKYENAQNILPKELIKKLQEYTDGVYLYIPKKDDNRRPWGECSGVKRELTTRNEEICKKYLNGFSVKELASKYHLTESSIRRIVKQVRDLMMR